MAHKFVQSIPPSAQRVFKGVIFDVYQWEQEMFDGSWATFEAITRPDYVTVIPVLENSTIVILEQEQPDSGVFYSFPGGRVDEGEEPEAAAQRELKEEAGVEATELVVWREYQPQAKIVYQAHEYVGRRCRKVSRPHPDAGERVVVHELSFDELIELASANDLFRHRNLVADFVRAKYDPGAREKLKKLLYG